MADQIDRDDFLSRCGYTVEQFQQTGLEWSLLQQVFERHTAMVRELQTAATYVSERLQALPAVHSLKIRIKDAEHLLEKIIRKKLQRPDDVIDCAKYEERITDLVGVRILHLFKDEWQPIHGFITDTWEIHDGPLAYVRRGDPDDMSQKFRDAGCKVEEHPLGYRSIHYVLKTQPAKAVRLVEIQVRTIFEEGWSEIDHKVRYPRQSFNPYLAAFLAIFNRLAGSADEMGSFTKTLDASLREQASSAEESARQIQRREAELEKTVAQLEISEVEKGRLQKQISELKSLHPAISMPDLSEVLKSIDHMQSVISMPGISEVRKSLNTIQPVTVSMQDFRSVMVKTAKTINIAEAMVVSSKSRPCTHCGKSFVQNSSEPSSAQSPAICPDCGSKKILLAKD